MNATKNGYATGSKDGTVGLWDTEFKPITRIDMNRHSHGYAGEKEYWAPYSLIYVIILVNIHSLLNALLQETPFFS